MELIFIFLISGLSGVLSTSGTYSCPTPGFTLSSDNSICFAFNLNYKSSPHHSVMCKAYGGQLLTIESSDKEALVVTYLTSISQTGSELYIMGLTNIIGGNDNWAWYQTAGNVSYTNWKDDYPESTTRSNCVAFTAGTPDNKWENLNCLTTKRSLCQKTYRGDVDRSVCEGNEQLWVEIGNKCKTNIKLPKASKIRWRYGIGRRIPNGSNTFII